MGARHRLPEETTVTTTPWSRRRSISAGVGAIIRDHFVNVSHLADAAEGCGAELRGVCQKDDSTGGSNHCLLHRGRFE